MASKHKGSTACPVRIEVAVTTEMGSALDATVSRLGVDRADYLRTVLGAALGWTPDLVRMMSLVGARPVAPVADPE